MTRDELREYYSKLFKTGELVKTYSSYGIILGLIELKGNDTNNAFLYIVYDVKKRKKSVIFPTVIDKI